MSGKAGLYVVVDTRGCEDGERPLAHTPMRRTEAKWLGMIVEVAGRARHGACCAHVTRIVSDGFTLPARRGTEGWATPWANLRPLEDPDEQAVEEHEEVTA